MLKAHHLEFEYHQNECLYAMATQHTVYKEVAYISARVMLITIYESSGVDSPLHFLLERNKF